MHCGHTCSASSESVVEQFVFEARNIFACIRPFEQVRKQGPKAFRKTKTRVLSIMNKG